MFLNTLKGINLFSSLIFICTTLQSQKNEILIKYKNIDSLHQRYLGENSEEAYFVYQKLLKESIQVSYVKGMLCAYKSLMWYHGTASKTNLDSVIHYTNLFEDRIKIESKSNNKELIKSLNIHKYYLRKGQILASGFGLPEQGLESYFKAYPLIPEGDKQLFIKYHVSISQIYFYKFQYDKALAVLNPLLKDTIGLETGTKIQLLKSIAANYVAKKMVTKSYQLHKEILNLTKKNKDIKIFWWTKDLLANDYFHMGEHQKAIDSALAVKKYCIKNDFSELLFNNSMHLSTYYHAIEDIDKAIAYRKEAVKHSDGLEFEIDTYKTLAGYYIEKKQYLNAIEIYQKKDTAIDSLRSSEKKALINYVDSSVKLLKEKQKSQQMLYDMELLEEKNKKQKLYHFSISIGLISIILFLGTILLFKKYKKGEKVIEVLKNNEKKLLEGKIVLRENELEASAIALSQRLEVLTSIKSELDQIKEPNITKLEDVKQKIGNLITSASDMSIITKRIESEYPTISNKLKNKYPELTDTQMRYCLLTKLNLSIKETAIILNVTPDTVKVARSRLKKKLEIPTAMSIKLFLDALTEVE